MKCKNQSIMGCRAASLLLLLLVWGGVSQAVYAEETISCSNYDIDYGFLSLFFVPTTTIVTGTFTDGKRHKGRLTAHKLSRPASPSDLLNPDFAVTINVPFDPPRLQVDGVDITIVKQINEQGAFIFWQEGRGYENQNGEKVYVIDFPSHQVDCEFMAD